MKQIIVTGSSSGFGMLTVKTLASKGHRVFATMRNINGSNKAAAGQLLEWAFESGYAVDVVEMDVTNETSVKDAISKIGGLSGGRIDVVVNNAGISFIGVQESLTMAQTEQMFQVNLFGADRVIKAVLPYMHKQKDGLIVNITSVLARNHFPLLSAYNASKAALDALSVGYHYELRSSGIDVVVVQPGGYPTTDIITKGIQAGNPAVESLYGKDMVTVKGSLIQYFTPTEESPNPQEVADAVAGLIAAPKGSRQLWTLVGAGGFEAALDNINQSTKSVVDTMLGYMGA